MPAATTTRPHVLVNVAMTADGKIDTIERGGARISSPEDIAAVDALRAEVDAIMVGGATFLGEDPRLMIRDEARILGRRAGGRPGQPRKVALVSELPATPATTSRFIHDGGGAVTIFTTERSTAAARDAWHAAGAEVLVAGGERVDLEAAIAHLTTLRVERLLVEGGGRLIAALFAGGFIDEFRQYIAPYVVGGAGAPTPLDGPGMPFAERVALELVATERLGPGIALRYRAARRAV